MLIAGAAFLLFKPGTDQPEHRAEVTPPPVEIPKAPDWVANGQDATPDYTPSTMEPKDATPSPEPAPAPKAKPVPEPVETVVEVREDAMVSLEFLDRLAAYVLDRFQPEARHGKPASLVSFKGMNIRFGRDPQGFAVDQNNIRKARQAILDYVFTPRMVRTLYDQYAPAFVERLANMATGEDREYVVNGKKQTRVLDIPEASAMFRLNAHRLEQAATVLRTIAEDPALTELSGKYLQAAKAVERANARFQTLLADEKEPGDAGERLKQSILQRERIKAEIVTLLKQACHSCEETDLFYLAMWSYRRTLDETEKLPVFAVSADCLDDLAQRFARKSEELGK